MHLWDYRLVQNWFYNVTCSEEEVLDGSGAIVLSKLMLTSRVTASACSSLVFISASGVVAISCCSGLSALEMFSAASWK